jgi:PD-(D/E)XK nuclease superfamily
MPRLATKHGPPRAFDPRKLSPSRMTALATCGIAFRMKYLEKLPEERSGSAALFGQVCHDFLEVWGKDRAQDILPLAKQAWLNVTEGTSVHGFIEAYQELAPEVIRAEHECRKAYEKRTKKESKAIHMSGEWKRHPMKKKTDKLFAKWLPKIEKDSFWKFNEYDPLPKLYNESLVLSRRYEQRWKHLPPVLYAEFEFTEEWEGFILNGYIDTIETLLDRETGELLGIGVNDYKTYARPPSEHKDYRQFVMYHIAVQKMIERGLFPDLPDAPLYIGADYIRWTDSWKDAQGKPFPPRRFWKLGPEDEVRLLREANAYTRTCEEENFLPAHKGTNPDFCSYPSNCCLRTTASAGGEATIVELPV